MKKITKKQYIRYFFTIVAVLAVIRFVKCGVWSEECGVDKSVECGARSVERETSKSETQSSKQYTQNKTAKTSTATTSTAFTTSTKHPIYSVPDFKNTFPDVQDVQIESALKYGVKSVANREDAEHRKKELVYVGANPYFHIDRLNSSIPYLVPRASMLVQDIGKAFFDSLYVKHIPMHKIIITSLLRTEEDVEKLRTRNGNATENSCHLYGTTVDICYNRYITVSDPDSTPRRQVQNDTLKWVLSEVLRDFRAQKRCWVKYEVKQGCFHITVN